MAKAEQNSESEVRKREYERKLIERIEKEDLDKRLLTGLWDAGDAVQLMEFCIRNYGPKTPEEPYSECFLFCVRWLPMMRDVRDRLYDYVYTKP